MKNKFYNFLKSVFTFVAIYAICYACVRMNQPKMNNAAYILIAFPSILIFMARHIIWKIAKPALIIFTIMPLVTKNFETLIIKHYDLTLHPVVKWLIIATIVSGIVALAGWTYKLAKNMVLRAISYCWEAICHFFRKLKFRLTTKRKEPCKIDLSIEQIDSLGNGDTYLKGKLFEEFIANLYRTAGYVAKTTGELRAEGKLPATIQKRGGSGEQGVDVIVEIPQKNGSVKILAIQCKHYSNKVENAAVQEITAALAMYKADQACVITNNFFTGPAMDLAKVNNVLLIDRTALIGLVERTVERYYKSTDKVAKKVENPVVAKVEEKVTETPVFSKNAELEKKLEEDFKNKKTVFQQSLETKVYEVEVPQDTKPIDPILPFKKKRKEVGTTSDSAKDEAWKKMGA